MAAMLERILCVLLNTNFKGEQRTVLSKFGEKKNHLKEIILGFFFIKYSKFAQSDLKDKSELYVNLLSLRYCTI